MTTGTAVHPVATPRDVRFAQALWFLVVVASIGTAAFISMANSNRSLDDVFVASNGGINRISSRLGGPHGGEATAADGG